MQRNGIRIVANGVGFDTTTPEYKFKTADQTGIGATLTDITELSWTISDTGTYAFEFITQLFNSTAAANSQGVAVNFTGSLSWLTAFCVFATTNTLANSSVVSIHANAFRVALATSTTVDRRVGVQSGLIVVTAPGVLSLQADSITTGTVGVRAGSYSMLQRIR